MMSRVLVTWLLLIAALQGCSDSREAPDTNVDTVGEDGERDADAADMAEDVGEGLHLTWTGCHDLFECSTVSVPIDYDHPEGGNLELALMRARARKPSERMGVIVVDLGYSAIDFVRWGWAVFILYWAPILDRFDLVAYDWRGMGYSEPRLACPLVPVEDVRPIWPVPADSEEWQQWEDYFGSYLNDCQAPQAPGLVANLQIETLTLDLEHVRQALGEAVISYLGVGLPPGVLYAARYPEHVRAFVLVSPRWPQQGLERAVELRALMVENALQSLFDRCADESSCVFHGGEDPAAIAAAYDKLYEGLFTQPLPCSDGRSLGPADFGVAVLWGLEAGVFDRVAAALRDAEQGDGSALMRLADTRFTVDYDNRTGDEQLELYGTPHLCSNIPRPADCGTDEFASFMTQLEQTSGARLARYSATVCAHCLLWEYAPSAMPSVDAASAPPLLAVASRYGFEPPLEEVMALLQSLNNGSHLLSHEGIGLVGVWSSQCVIQGITDFFIDPTAEPTDCAAGE